MNMYTTLYIFSFLIGLTKNHFRCNPNQVNNGHSYDLTSPSRAWSALVPLLRPRDGHMQENWLVLHSAETPWVGKIQQKRDQQKAVKQPFSANQHNCGGRCFCTQAKKIACWESTSTAGTDKRNVRLSTEGSTPVSLGVRAAFALHSVQLFVACWRAVPPFPASSSRCQELTPHALQFGESRTDVHSTHCSVIEATRTSFVATSKPSARTQVNVNHHEMWSLGSCTPQNCIPDSLEINRKSLLTC